MASTPLTSKLIEGFLEPTYLVREVNPIPGEKEAYEIAKFSGGDTPTGVYRVGNYNGSWHCDCMGFKGKSSSQEHKHIAMVKAWIARGKPDSITTKGFQDWIQSYL